MEPILLLFGVMVVLSAVAVRIGSRDLPHPLQNFWFAVYDRGYDPTSQSESPELRLYHAATGDSRQLIGPEARVGRYAMEWSVDHEWLFYEEGYRDRRLRRVKWTGNADEDIYRGGIWTAIQLWQNSPDYQNVAWLEVDGMTSSLYIAEVDGSGIRLLQDEIPYADVPIEVYWSANSEWIYVIGTMTYGLNDYSRPLEVFGIRRDGTDFQKLATIEEASLRNVNSAGEYLVFTTTRRERDALTFYALHVENRTFTKLVGVNGVSSYPVIRIESDKVLFSSGTSDGRFRYVVIELKSGRATDYYYRSDGIFFGNSYEINWSPEGNVFDIYGDYEDFSAPLRLIVNADGQRLAEIPNAGCNVRFASQDFESIWLDGTLYFFGQAPSESCRLMQLSRDYMETTVLQNCPPNADYFAFLEIENQWWVVYDIERTEYLTNFDGSDAYRLIELGED
jgi:hypothetical protein